MFGVDHPRQSCPKVLVMWLSHFLLAPAPQNIQSMENSSWSRNPKALKIQKGPKELLLSYCFVFPGKIFERFMHASVGHIIDLLHFPEQTGFRRGSSTVDQAVLLTQNIVNCFEAKRKAVAAFADLTAAYDSVWHHCITCELLRLLTDKHIIQIIMELVQDRTFTPTTGSGKQSRFQYLKIGVLQGPVLAPLLYNIYTYDLPSLASKKYA